MSRLRSLVSRISARLARPLHVAAAVALLALIAISVSYQGTHIAEQGVAKRAFRLPEGIGIYRIAQADEVWPKITEARINPLDVHVGMTQIIEATVEGRHPIDRVMARIQTDKDDVLLPLELVGPAADGKPGSRYSGSWTVHDTHDTTYRTVISAEGGGDRSEVTLAWSDACGIPAGGSFTLSSPCTISASDGIDAGNMTVNSSLTLNADFAINSGNSFTLGAGGSIAICEGCQIRKTNIWQVDADADGYPANGQMFLQDTAPTNGRRRNLLSTTVDCNDNAYSTTNTCSTTCWPDADGDGYFSVNSQSSCTGSYSTSQGNDCYDANANARPGQTQYFTTNRGDGSYDYNCDNTETKQYDYYGDAGCPCEEFGYGGMIPACGSSGLFYIGPGPFSDCDGGGKGRCDSQSQAQYCR